VIEQVFVQNQRFFFHFKYTILDTVYFYELGSKNKYIPIFLGSLHIKK